MGRGGAARGAEIGGESADAGAEIGSEIDAETEGTGGAETGAKIGAETEGAEYDKSGAETEGAGGAETGDEIERGWGHISNRMPSGSISPFAPSAELLAAIWVMAWVASSPRAGRLYPKFIVTGQNFTTVTPSEEISRVNRPESMQFRGLASDSKSPASWMMGLPR